MELIINKCPICGKDGDVSNICKICGRNNFSDDCFDQDSCRCLNCLWDPAILFSWADGCNIPVSKLPRDRGELSALTELSLTANGGIYCVETIPSELANLTSLEKLWIAAHPVREFPADLSKLTNLKHVSLDTLELDKIPDFVFELPKLEKLSLTNNRLSEIPEGLSRIRSLNCLVLPDNLIDTLPESMAALSQLRELYLWGNRLSFLPDFLFEELPELKVINVDGNPLDLWLENNSSKLANYSTYVQYNN